MAYIIQPHNTIAYQVNLMMATNNIIKANHHAFFLFRCMPKPNLKPPNLAIVFEKLINIISSKLKVVSLRKQKAAWNKASKPLKNLICFLVLLWMQRGSVGFLRNHVANF